jgi:hypothetical protein
MKAGCPMSRFLCKTGGHLRRRRRTRLPDERWARLKSLLGVLHDEAEELLVQNKVWDVSTCGWEDADTPNAEYFGIAIWEMNPPFEHEWGTLLEGHTPKHHPTERDEILLRTGEDLIATMIFARRSLGMALCFAAVSDPAATGGNDEFWQEYATTLMWLNIACDRMRDFFLMARFGQRKKQYEERYRVENKTTKVPYSAPFKAGVQGVASNLSKCLNELALLTENLQEHRHERNVRVHEIATIAAQRSLYLLREQRRLAGQANSQTSPIHYDEALPLAVEAMKVWFGRLMKATALVFEFEYFDRIKK